MTKYSKKFGSHLLVAYRLGSNADVSCINPKKVNFKDKNRKKTTNIGIYQSHFKERVNLRKKMNQKTKERNNDKNIKIDSEKVAS